MRILIVTMNDSKGLTLAETLSKSYDIIVLHSGKIEFECPFNEHEIIEEELNTFSFDDFDFVIYLASESLPCQILTSVLHGVRSASKTRCICIAEAALNASFSSEYIPERFICKGYSDQARGLLSFWTVSPLYGEDFLPEPLMQSIAGRIKNNRVIIPGSEEDFFDLLHVEDLANALDKYIQLQEYRPEVVLTSGQTGTMKELGKVLKNHAPQVNINYKDAAQGSKAIPESSFIGWTPKHSYTAELPEVIQLIEREGSEILAAERGHRSKITVKILSFLGVFALVCIYTSFIRTSSELQFVDVRLLFVISACLFWGSKYGLSAAVLCSAASVIQSIASGTQWHVIFFHIDNWIPITVYLACAVLFGMYKENQPST